MREGADAWAAFLAGGTNLVDLSKGNVAWPTWIVDIKRSLIHEITDMVAGRLRLGALATSSAASDKRLVERCPLLISRSCPALRALQRSRRDGSVKVGMEKRRAARAPLGMAGSSASWCPTLKASSVVRMLSEVHGWRDRTECNHRASLAQLRGRRLAPAVRRPTIPASACACRVRDAGAASSAQGSGRLRWPQGLRRQALRA